MTVAFVGIGSNLELPREQVRRAFSELGALPRTRLTKKSSLYRSAPIGYADQPDFINAVAVLESSLTAMGMLFHLQRIENRHRRKRPFRNAPRTLDLDLLTYGRKRLSTRRLALPHPRLHQRAFVLAPLTEIAPGAIIPGVGAARYFLKKTSAQNIARIA